MKAWIWKQTSAIFGENHILSYSYSTDDARSTGSKMRVVQFIVLPLEWVVTCLIQVYVDTRGVVRTAAVFLLLSYFYGLKMNSDSDINEYYGDKDPEFIPETSTPTKKRKLNENKWTVNVRKFNLNTGKQYVSKTGKLIPARKFSNCQCKKHCLSQVTDLSLIHI